MRRTVIEAVVLLLVVLGIIYWVESRRADALDREAAAEIEAIRARAKGEPVVIVKPGPVRIVERERIVVQRVAPGAVPVASVEVETQTKATGAPVVDCTQRPGALVSTGGQVRCPEPDLGCRTEITGWRTELGNVIATGTQTLRWRWPDQDWQESSVDLTPANTTVTALPMVLQPDPAPRWIAGALVGLDSHGSIRYGAVAARRLGGYRGVDLHAVAVGMVGGGDVIVTASVGVGF